ncbi:MAG: fumarate hydratase [Deltaproteobacteria bacterium]|jgi:fumarate hydratase subunit alpha|nr:fumarate hydratase [Deltaproteobacteria bacterium]
MRIISTEIISAEVRDLFLSSAFLLPQKVIQRLKQALELETAHIAQSTLKCLLENANLATSSYTPLCQDTGMAQVVMELGQEISLEGPPLAQAVEKGIRQAYEVGFLRKSTCHPLTRKNLMDNTPGSLETIIVPGEKLSIWSLAKGGGCDNKSRLINLSPTSSLEEIKAVVVKAVIEAGPDACPPLCLGLAIGGSFESAPKLARRALLELWEEPKMTDEENDLAQELLHSINATGLGPMGLGGMTTALGIRVKIQPTHLASLPLALNINCHSLRTNYVSF